jgi:hypothetical protein
MTVVTRAHPARAEWETQLGLAVPVYFPALKEYRMACWAQLSTHVPQRMHSLCSIAARWIMPWTSRLIGQLEVHFRQSLHDAGVATSRNAGHATRLRSLRPMIMNGAIQQMV